MISIIIRTKNEERWIVECLKRIMQQKISEQIEIILVDNNSEDQTVAKAVNFYPEIKIVHIQNYLPGKAINLGVKHANGEFFSVISAHCLPSDEYWLHNLRKNMDEADVAGVYGRQIPMSYSDPVDKRDLLVTFGMDRIVQKRGTFFHNANSMVRRSVWEKIPFESEITNIEDRIWGKRVIKAGLKIVYEPDACVYHYHGIHQNNDYTRLNNVVRIFDEYQIQNIDEKAFPLKTNELKICAVIPFRSADIEENELKQELFDYAYQAIKTSEYINRIILFTDDNYLLNYAESFIDVESPIVRDTRLSSVRLTEVFKSLLKDLATREKYFPDLVVPVELIYPFRPEGLFDDMILKLLHNGFDTVVPGYQEYRACWKKNNETFLRLDDHLLKREQRDPIHVGVLGLGFVTYTELLRQGIKYGSKLGLVEYKDPLIKLELRTKDQMRYFKLILNAYHENAVH